MQWSTVVPRLLEGALTTLEVTLASALLAVVLASLAGVMRASPHRLVRAPAAVYVETFRGTSAFVQIYWIFFVLPLLGVTLPVFTAGVVVLGLNIGAYGSEVVRGAIRAVDPGQREAALALNLSPRVTTWRIVFPQAFPRMIAPFGNLLVELLKGSSLLSAISLTELTFSAKTLVDSGGHAAGTYGLVLLLYLLMGLPLVFGVRRFERHATRNLRLGESPS